MARLKVRKYCLNTLIFWSCVIFLYSTFKLYSHKFRTIRLRNIPNELQDVIVHERNDPGTTYLKNMFFVPDEMNERTRKLTQIHDYIYETLDKLQNDGDCEKKKIIRCHNSVMSGFGSSIHRQVICLHIAFALGRTFIIDHDYRNFNGLANFTLLESGKCNYLKYNLSTVTDRCNFKNLECYLDDFGFEINNTYKVLDFTHEANFPAPRFIPGTLPKKMEKKLYELGVKNPWHWFTAQLLGYMILRPNEEFQKKVIQTVNLIQLKKPSIGIHLRRGDKHTESKVVAEETFADAVLSRFNKSHGEIFVASDDHKAVASFASLLDGAFQVRNIPAQNLTTRPRNDRGRDTMESILVDLYLLSGCEYSLITYSSNVGRLVWELKTAMFPYDAQDRIISLKWELLYSWYDYNARMKYYLTVADNEMEHQITKDVKIMPYKKGQLFVKISRRTVTNKDGQEVNLIRVIKRHSKSLVGHIFEKDLITWPGEPTYENDIP